MRRKNNKLGTILCENSYDRRKQHNQRIKLDIQPERDLWPDIKSNIRFAGKPETLDSESELLRRFLRADKAGGEL